MPSDKHSDSSRKRKSKCVDDPTKQKTSEDLLASLFNDLESTGKVEDLALLINANDKEAKKPSSKSSKHKDETRKRDKSEPSKSDSKLKEKSGSKQKEKKKKSKDEKTKKSKKDVKKDKSPKKKSKRTRSRSKSIQKSLPSTKRRISRSRSPIARKRQMSPPNKKERQRSNTPQRYRTTWNDFRSKIDWGQRHSRDNGGFLPWERDRWSRERSRSWSPSRYKRRRESKSPKPKDIDERRIDKKELLALARKNAARLAMEGRLPKGIDLGSTLKNKSVRELIELCEEVQSQNLEISNPENVVVDKDKEYDTADFSTAPVRSSSIKINLKEGSSRDTKSNLERMIEDNALKKHFPVSFGDNHKGKTDKMTKEWMPVEIEVEKPAAEEGVVTSLSKKTVKIPTAYTAYKAPEIKPKKEPSPEEFGPFQLPLIPAMPEMLSAPFPMPMFPMPSFNGIFSGFEEPTGYEAPEIIEAGFFPPPPPPINFSSFENPVRSPSELTVPEPAPLKVVSNAELIEQAEQVQLEKEAEEILKAVISNGESTEEPTKEEVESPQEENNTEVPMEVGNSPHNDEEISTTLPSQEFVLPEGAVLKNPVAPVSIGGLVSRRARLVQELALDPDNHHKHLEIADIDMKLSIWAKVKNDTTARFGAASNMSYTVEPRPIMNSVWATKDTLRNAPEFKGGIGEHLLKKMGWAPGQGLGRNMDGPIEPLTLDVKADRKGLYSTTKDKLPPRREHASVLNGNKNPVSVIMEWCAKQGVPPPLFVSTEDGTTNNRRFGCNAILNGISYSASTTATNKKAAKSQCALIMCQSLGLGLS